MVSVNNSLFSVLIKSTVNDIGDTGATSLSDALKSNTTLTKLNLFSQHKRNNTQMTPINNPLFSTLKSTANNIGDTGATSLSDALRSNTTLTRLDLRCKCKRSNTQMVSINKPLFSVLIKSTANPIGDTGMTSLGEALKSNTTLTKIDLGGKHKRNITQMASINNPLFSIFIKSTGNSIGDTGAKSLSDALKSNTTLKQLDLERENKRNNKQMTSINNQLFSIFNKSTVNDIGDTGVKSLSDSLKSNTTLQQLDLDCEHKRNNTQMASINNQLFFHSQQGTTSDTQEQHH